MADPVGAICAPTEAERDALNAQLTALAEDFVAGMGDPLPPDEPLAEPQFAPGIEAEIGRVEGRERIGLCGRCGHRHVPGSCAQCVPEGECVPVLAAPVPAYDPLEELRRIEDKLEDAAGWIELQRERVRNQIKHVMAKRKKGA